MTQSKVIDRLIVLTGFGSWLLTAASLSMRGWSLHAMTEPSFTSISNWLLVSALIAGVAAAALYLFRIFQLRLLSLSFLAGFSSAALLAAYMLVWALK